MKWLLGSTAVVAMLSSPAFAGLLTLSNASSDETSPTLLSATLQFEVNGDQLELTVTNNTGPDGYEIASIFFNASSDVAGLTLTSHTALNPTWGLTAGPPGNVGPFGSFDFRLQPSPPGGLGIGDSDPAAVFTFTITPSVAIGDVTQEDFVTVLSTIPGNSPNPPAFAAAHFRRGPGDDSAFGAVVIPEASSILTFAMVGGAFGCVQLRRRRS